MGLPNTSRSLLLGAAGQAGADTEYLIERSLRFNSADSAYLNRTPASAGNRKTWTWAGWVKRSNSTGTQCLYFGGPSDSTLTRVLFNPEILLVQSYDSGSISANLVTSAVYRDFSAWMHCLVAVDTTQSTSSNRIKIYINGTQVTSFTTSTYPSQNYDTHISSANKHSIGAEDSSAIYYLYNGYLADVHFIDGQALDPTSFGEFDANGIFQPIEYTGTYGTNGFHLPFSDNSTAAALGTDTSGNGNDWTVNNISVAAGSGNDSLVDVPTNGTEEDTGVGGEVRGNYCTWNPLQKNANVTLLNGNLNYTTTGAYPTAAIGTIGVSSGKWYYETVCTASPFTPPVLFAGLVNTATFNLPSSGFLDVTGVYAYSLREGGTVSNGSFSASGWGSAAVNDVIGVAFDIDAGTVSFYKNNSLLGTLSGLSGTFAPFIAADTSSSPTSAYTNFGQRPFAFTAPAGFKALNTANLSTPVITKPSEYMDVKLWTGDGTSGRDISGLGFSPDLTWIKVRNIDYEHILFDTVRGAGNRLFSNLTNAESYNPGTLYSFTSDGFVLGDGVNLDFSVNENTRPYVSWNWDAGSSTVTNTDGSITSSVRANASAGFSIVSYTGNGSSTGATVGHGLGVAPSFFIIKNRSASSDWVGYHSAIGSGYFLILNSTSAAVSSAIWDGAPSSTVLKLNDNGGGTFTETNTNGQNYVAYCFAPVAGYSAFGSYTGNGSADGPFVFCGFRPRWIVRKRTDSAGAGWYLIDTARDTFNVSDAFLDAADADAEATGTDLDILSNGFKLRNPDAGTNASGGTYIYAAFAESPFQYARAR